MAPTLASVDCRFDALISMVIESPIPADIASTLLAQLHLAQVEARHAGELLATGRSRAATGALAHAVRNLTAFQHLLRSLRVSRLVAASVRSALIDRATAIAADIHGVRRGELRRLKSVHQ